jgi:antitoxin component of RelBE/YafQ-DinJ toxin-antitoxin module
LEENQKKININIGNSLFSKIHNYIKDDVQSLKADFQKKTISINFGSNCSILIDNIYYNRISSDKIKALKETNTNSMYFIIPSTDNSVLFYIRQVNEKLSELLANNEKNIYEQFLEFEPDMQKELLEFSNNTNVEDGTNKLDYQQKIIYIPSFKIETHLYSYDIKNIIQNITINNKENNEKLYLSSVDEYMNIELKIDDNIKNCFSFNLSEDKNSNMIIKDQFIIGIFANKIINNERLPLIQFLHVKKEDFLPKKN